MTSRWCSGVDDLQRYSVFDDDVYHRTDFSSRTLIDRVKNLEVNRHNISV